MKFQTALTTIGAFATSASAIGGQHIPIPGMGGGPPKRPGGRPQAIENWKWTNHFSPENKPKLNKKYYTTCNNERTFHAEEFLLDDLSVKPPHGILGYREGLKKVFSKLEYPGSWEGIDPHGYDRNLLMMAYDQVPLAVREWIEDQQRVTGDEEKDKGKHPGLFAVFERADEKGDIRPTATVSVAPTPSPIPRQDREGVDDKRVVIFAPGALYETLPLWVSEGAGCDLEMLDITKYSPTPKDGHIVAYPIRHTRAKRMIGWREMEFTIRADLLALKEGEKDDEEIKGPPAAKKVEEKKEAPKTEEKEDKKEAPKEEKKEEGAPKTEEKKEEKEEEKKEKDEL